MVQDVAVKQTGAPVGVGVQGGERGHGAGAASRSGRFGALAWPWITVLDGGGAGRILGVALLYSWECRSHRFRIGPSMSDISPGSPAKLQAEIRKLLPLLHKAAGKAKVSPQAVMMTAAGLAVHVIKRHCETKVDALQHVTAAMWDDLAAALDAPGHDDARNDRATGGRPQRGGRAICRRRRLVLMTVLAEIHCRYGRHGRRAGTFACHGRSGACGTF